jgi:serine/threonine protein kinase
LELLKKNDYLRASQNFRTAIELDPNLKNNSNVLKLFAGSLQNLPTNLKNQESEKEILKVANWLRESNQLYDASEIYESCQPKNEEILLILIHIYQELNNTVLIKQRISELADVYLLENKFQKIVELSSFIEPNASINQKLSIAYENLKDMENAAKCLFLVAKEFFEYSSLNYCIDILKKAEQMNPNSIDILDLFFQAYSKLGDDISSSMYCVKMGKYYESVKENKKSEDCYKTALNLDPKAFTVTKKSKGGEYIQIKKLAAGGQACVYVCKNKSSSSKRQIICAMKELVCDGFGDANKAMAELLVINEISHPNIIEFLDMYLEINPKSEETTLSIIMPYYTLGDLHKYWLSQKDCKKSEILNFSKQIVEGIQHLHQHKIIHRDLKPANILMHSNSNGEMILKLADFGLSSQANETSMQQSVVGTSDWMAHEVRSGSKYDGRKADMFSFGLIMYFLISQTVVPAIDLVLSSKNSLQNMSKVIIQNGFSNAIKDLVLNLLSEDPNERPSPKEVIEILDNETNNIAPSSIITPLEIMPPMPKQILATSLRNFQSMNSDQISVSVDEKFVIILKSEDWSCIRKGKEIGMIPTMIIKEID